MDTTVVQEIVNALSRDVGRPVVLEDSDQQPIVHSPHYGQTDRMRRDTIMHQSTSAQTVEYFRRYDLASRTDPFVVPGNDRGVLPRLCVPLRYDEKLLGFVWVLLPEGEIDDGQRAAVERASESLAETLWLDRLSRLREGRIIEDLLNDDHDRRLRGLVAVEAKHAFDAPARSQVLVAAGPGWAVRAARRAFLMQRWVADPASQLRLVDVDEGVAVVATRPATGGSAGGLDLEALERSMGQVNLVTDDMPVVLGVGPAVASPSALPRSHRRARQAATVALRVGSSARRVSSWEGLGVYRLLIQLPREALADGVDPRLVGLVQDAPEVATTLEVYLDGGGAVAAAATALHIHRTTLYYRLEKVSEVGFDLREGEDRMTIQVGFAALRLLGRWPA
ncbi:PucR family transcriptional regulator [Euzebya rosea]|uniref:PucR family transcriptional regulator n=1 Tax=Euzebya rosea TaxID=2052804 RepID=UPI000D3E7C3D|nr:PucR family transcriptional regulator [Euzebya rosea]